MDPSALDGWLAADDGQGDVYYHHSESKITVQLLKTTVNKGWRPGISDGHVFYINVNTGATTWSNPAASSDEGGNRPPETDSDSSYSLPLFPNHPASASAAASATATTSAAAIPPPAKHLTLIQQMSQRSLERRETQRKRAEAAADGRNAEDPDSPDEGAAVSSRLDNLQLSVIPPELPPSNNLSVKPPEGPSSNRNAGPHPSSNRSAGPHPSSNRSAGPHPSSNRSAGPHPSSNRSAGPHPSPIVTVTAEDNDDDAYRYSSDGFDEFESSPSEFTTPSESFSDDEFDSDLTEEDKPVLPPVNPPPPEFIPPVNPPTPESNATAKSDDPRNDYSEDFDQSDSREMGESAQSVQNRISSPIGVVHTETSDTEMDSVSMDEEQQTYGNSSSDNFAEREDVQQFFDGDDDRQRSKKGWSRTSGAAKAKRRAKEEAGEADDYMSAWIDTLGPAKLRRAMLGIYRANEKLKAKSMHDHEMFQQLTETYQQRSKESAQKIAQMENNYLSMETGYNLRIRDLMGARAAHNAVMRQKEGTIRNLRVEIDHLQAQNVGIRREMKDQVTHFEQKYRECVAQQHRQLKEHEKLIQQHSVLRLELAKQQQPREHAESRYQALTNALKKVLAEFGSPEDRPMFKAMTVERHCGRAMLFEALKRSECAICYENQSNSVINPCGHCAVCTECIKRLDKCPICRVGIQSWVRIYV